MKITGLWIPLITPLYHGKFDEQSAKKLIETTQEFTDGYVVGLSSGEGEELSNDVWQKAISCAVSSANKPVAAGILGKNIEQVVSLSETAKKLGCVAVVIPAAGKNEEEIVRFFSEIDSKTSLPVIIYNTEKTSIHSVENLLRLDNLEKIIAIKDSSGDQSFFSEAISQKSKLKMSVLQGMENQLLQSKGCDGYLISLGNVEPQLCKTMFENPIEENNQNILAKFWEYNLGGEWYITLKALLYARGVIRSAEQVKQVIKI
jgi:4-hydroxy-tetrahydrodipicolinate synthase